MPRGERNGQSSGVMERYRWRFEARRHAPSARRVAKERTCHAGSATVSPVGRWNVTDGGSRCGGTHMLPIQ